ncbi:MAG: nucleotidyltransferase domain-containing protein [Muribaculaceae bacterium]|nr:nucleotidyltransferase domain-containing protein [Muribaculaceae bacterium]
MKLIELNISKIIELCKNYRVKSLAVFGSILTERFNNDSDIDMIVNFDDTVTYHTYADYFFGLHDNLKKLLGRDIDLVDESSINNKYFKEEIDETKRLIYG